MQALCKDILSEEQSKVF